MSLGNDKKRYDIILQHAAKLITPLQVSLLKLGLSLHVYSPKVEMFAQIAREHELPDCAALADIGGDYICDAQSLHKAIQNVRLLNNLFIAKYIKRCFCAQL